MPVERWSDDRLDDLNRRVIGVEGVVPDMAVMKTEMRNLARELGRNTTATEHVAQQFEDSKIEPLTRSRTVRTQITVAVIGAMAGGVFVLLGVLLSKA